MNDQMEIISGYCGNIKERIRSCKSRKIALLLRDSMCSEFKSRCKSDIVANLLLKYSDDLIDATFDKNGMNIYLEENNEI
jgi:hypothetical protein